jgi:putative transposase
LLDDDRAKQIVVTLLASEVAGHGGKCVGYVIMPDHVHTIVWFPERSQLSHFMKQWKQRSSASLKKLFQAVLSQYAATVDAADPVWQRKYYSFNLYTDRKMREKLDYMHANPVRAGLVARACEWPWSSARFYELNQPVGVPIQWIGE